MATTHLSCFFSHYLCIGLSCFSARQPLTLRCFPVRLSAPLFAALVEAVPPSAWNVPWTPFRAPFTYLSKSCDFSFSVQSLSKPKSLLPPWNSQSSLRRFLLLRLFMIIYGLLKPSLLNREFFKGGDWVLLIIFIFQCLEHSGWSWNSDWTGFSLTFGHLILKWRELCLATSKLGWKANSRETSGSMEGTFKL